MNLGKHFNNVKIFSRFNRFNKFNNNKQIISIKTKNAEKYNYFVQLKLITSKTKWLNLI